MNDHPTPTDQELDGQPAPETQADQTGPEPAPQTRTDAEQDANETTDPGDS